MKEKRVFDLPPNYKTDKKWLTVPLVTASVIAGLSLSTPVHADVTDNATSNSEPALENSNQKATTDTVDNTPSDTTSSNDDTSSSDRSVNDQTEDSKSNNDDTLKSSTVDSSENLTKAVTQSNALDPSDSSENSDDPNGSDTTSGTQTSTDNQGNNTSTDATTEPATTDQTTVPEPTTISAIPTLANFYIDATGKYVLYNAKAKAQFAPYITERLIPGDQLYGFYLVLPLSITGNLAEFQTGANNYVTDLNNQTDPDINISSLTVYQLNNTSDGRQVFYFKPNDGASVIKSVDKKTVPYKNRTKMKLPITTGADIDTTPKTVSFNAGNKDELKDFGVLYAGVGDNTYSKGGYSTIASSDLGSNIPDKNILGIALTSGSGVSMKRTLTYTHVNVTDTYNVKSASDPTGANLQTITKSGQDGTTYSRADLLADLQTAYPDSQFNIDSGTMTDEIKLMPTSLESSTTAGIAGNTYTIYVDDSKLQTTGPISLTVGQTFDPTANLTLTDSGDSNITGNSAYTDGKLTYNLTDSSGASVTDMTAAGTYTVTYSYVDSLGNTVTTTNTITVLANNSALTTKDLTINTNDPWNYKDNVTGVVDNDGNDVSVDGADIAATYLDANNQPLDTIDTSVTGVYTINYTYTDPLGIAHNNIASAKLTIVAKHSSGGSGSNSGNGSSDNNSSGDNHTGDDGSSNNNDPDGNTSGDNGTGSNDDPSDNNSNGNDNNNSDNDSDNTSNNDNLLSDNTSTSGNNPDSAPDGSVLNTDNSVGLIKNYPSDSSKGKLPQTGEQTTWYAQLGMLLLTVAGVLGFKRKKNE